MAIALDASGRSGTGMSVSASSPKTWSHTCTGSNLFLCVGLYFDSGLGVSAVAVTYNGVSMTQSQTQGSAGNSNLIYIFTLVNPTTGANTVSVSWTGTAPNMWGVSASFTGVKQTGQPEANNGTVGTASPISTSVTTVSDNSWLFAMCGGSINSGTAAITPAQTTIFTVTNGVEAAGASRQGPITPAGSTSNSFTISGGTIFHDSIAAISFGPATASVADQYILIS